MTKEIPDLNGSMRNYYRKQILNGIEDHYRNTDDFKNGAKLVLEESDEQHIKFVVDQVMAMTGHDKDITDEMRKTMITTTINFAVNNIVQDAAIQSYGGKDGNTD
jgi:hypothetical protein